MRWPRITLVEIVVEWILPIIGASLTWLLLLRFGVPLFWACLLAMPGAMVFQWSVLLALKGCAELIELVTSIWRCISEILGGSLVGASKLEKRSGRSVAWLCGGTSAVLVLVAVVWWWLTKER